MNLKNAMKRLVSAVLVVTLFGFIIVFPQNGHKKLIEPIVAEALNWELVDDYPSKYKGAALDALVDEWKYYNRECTSFVAWRLNSRNGVAFHNYYGGVNFGNATTWGGAARSIGITVDMNPAPGSVFWQQGEYGHVAWVNTVNGDGTVTIEEYNWNRDGEYHNRTVSVNSASGYIHIKDIDPTPIGHIMSEEEAAGQTIPDGDYWICSALNHDYFLDIPGDEISQPGVNIETWTWKKNMPTQYDVFTVKYKNNGFYEISQKDTDLCLDVSESSLKRGANIQLWTRLDNNAQSWSIGRTEKGYYIQARCGAWFADIVDAKVANGQNVWNWEGNGSKCQHWSFIPYKPVHTVDEGLYRIHSAVDDSYVLDVSGMASEGYKDCANVQIWDSTGDDVFKITYDKDGYYYISEAVSGKVLDVELSDPDYLNNKRNIEIYSKGDQRNQKWAIIPAKNGTYYIISQLSGYCIDLVQQKNEYPNGTNVEQYQYEGNTNQLWNLVPVTTKNEDTTTTTTTTTTTKTTVKKTTTTTAKKTTQTTAAKATTVPATQTTTAISELSIGKTSITLKNGQQYTINANQTGLTYKSNRTDIAVVSKSGIVTAIGEGDAIISVINSDGDVAQLKVTVIPANSGKSGDANGDGNIDIADSVKILQFLANAEKYPLTEEGAANADCDGETGITGSDALAVQMYDAKMIVSLPLKK